MVLDLTVMYGAAADSFIYIFFIQFTINPLIPPGSWPGHSDSCVSHFQVGLFWLMLFGPQHEVQKEATAAEMIGQRWDGGTVPEEPLRTDHIPCQQSILRAGREVPSAFVCLSLFFLFSWRTLYMMYFFFLQEFLLLRFTAASVKWLNQNCRISHWLRINWGAARVWKHSNTSPRGKEQVAQRAGRPVAFTLLIDTTWSVNQSEVYSMRFIPVQTLGCPGGLALRNVCPHSWMGSRHQWECWKGLSDALWKIEAPRWEMRPRPTRGVGPLLQVLQALEGCWVGGTGCSPARCCESSDAELLQSWVQE